jgi:hypothetical protein
MTQPELPESYPDPVKGEVPEPGEEPSQEKRPSIFAAWYETLAHLGLGETLGRIVTTAIFLVLILAVVWIIRAFYKDTSAGVHSRGALAAEPTTTGPLAASALPALDLTLGSNGVRRFANLHTIIPDRPRKEMTYYDVVDGDTIIGIAEKYGLQPQTVLWGNYNTLRDDPHNLRAGQKLNILPVDGTYYEWQAGDGLNAVAKFFGVKAEDIVNYPPNKLDAATIGDFANPNIDPGTWLIVPGGTRPFISWSAPAGVTRENPAVASVLGPGACGKVEGGAIGTGTFYWPTDHHFLSGFDFSPATNHYGIDLDGETGDPIYSSDSGVIVYAGWNDWGYGNMILIDHGNGWQTLYAHLSQINVVCGESVGVTQVIGLMGSTGNSTGSHLHFEMHHGSTKVNPWQYLPPP